MRAAELKLNEVQQLVADTFAAFFEREVPTRRVRAADATRGFDEALWRSFASLGGERASLEDEGGTFLDAVLIGFEAGRRLAPIPYAEVVAALRLAAAVGLCVDELDLVEVVEREHLSTSDPLAAAGAVVDSVIVIEEQFARLLRIQDRDRTPLRNLGGLAIGRLHLATADTLASRPVTAADTAEWRADLRLLRAALLVGAGDQALSLAVAHVRERVQFDRPIGSFQALQHRLATSATQLRAAGILCLRGGSYERADPCRRAAAAIAVVAASDAAELATREALQMFGGYGYSLEYDVHLYLRAVKTWRVLSRADALPDTMPPLSWGNPITV